MEVTNPLIPIGKLQSAVLNGTIDGKPFHTETTLLPYTRLFEWPAGHQVETLVSQYVAFLDGKIQEVALDYYAQADDGSVWYFGEDVLDKTVTGPSGSLEGAMVGEELHADGKVSDKVFDSRIRGIPHERLGVW